MRISLAILIFQALVPFLIGKVFAQSYPINTYNGQTVNTCAGTFLDSGLEAGNYLPNENYQVHFSAACQLIKLDFTQFDLPIGGGDELRVYDGPNEFAPLIASYTESQAAFSVQSSGSDLTIQFISDAANEGAGWEATLSCILVPEVQLNGLDSVYDANTSPPVAMSGLPAGGSYSGTGVSGNVFVPSLAGVGSHEIIYEFTDGTGCTNSDTVVVEVRDYDFIAGAYLIPNLSNWQSADAMFSTLGATADGNAGSCWNYGNNHTRWFRFQATGNEARMAVLTSGSYGTVRRIQAAIWEADAATEVACNRYVLDNDSVIVQSTALIAGNWYYLSVASGTGGYRGTFSLKASDAVDYDLIQGAFLIPSMDNWMSDSAQFTSYGATAVGNVGSCWNYGNDYTRWFRFQATTSQAKLTLLTGNGYGTARRINAALWTDDANTEIACRRYESNYDSVIVQSGALVPGNWYLLSVTTGNGGYRGSYTLKADDAMDYDWYEGAYEIPSLNNWSSDNEEFTTYGATADGNRGGCWRYNPDYTRWFKFQATGEKVRFAFRTGGTYGTGRRINASIWEADGTTEISCNRYRNDYDSVIVQSPNLTPGNWYYVSMTTGNGGYRGSFSLNVQDTVDYDYYEGAYTLPSTNNWQSADAEFSTYLATADGTPPSCWNQGVEYTRWFRFQASTNQIYFKVRTGGSYGTGRYMYGALFEADGTTELNCARYISQYDSLLIQSQTLTPGNWYYVAITNHSEGYTGSFSLEVNDQVDYDFMAGAYELTDLNNWCSQNAQFTTRRATPDGIPGSCWNTGANYTRWFRFQATTSMIKANIKTGGEHGDGSYFNAAIFESDGATEVACNRYLAAYDSIVLQSLSLTPGDWYYIAVTNYAGWATGSFTLCVNDQVNYDYYEGAVELNDITMWESADTVYTTRGASPDRNRGSCHSSGPSLNRWFRFQANSNQVSIAVQPTVSGSASYLQATLWESDGTTEISCNQYISRYDTVRVEAVNLTPGNWYYLSVDARYNQRGYFSLKVDNKVDYDFYEGAFELQDLNKWCSAPDQFTTRGATADRNAASCWNTTPNYNRWFKFTATTHKVRVAAQPGDPSGNPARRLNVAIWEADGTTELACNRYVYTNDTVVVNYDSLTPGNTYYVSVDNNYHGYRGTFSLCIDEQMDYDYQQGAEDITSYIGSCTPNAAYTTVGATADGTAPPCWNTSPNYNRWFKFMATTYAINVKLLRGGSYGTIRRANLALYDTNGTTVLDCNRYAVDADENVEVSYEGLVPGKWYYIAVDNNYYWYRGSFTLCLDDKPGYDFYEGAKELGIIHDWQSPEEAYTTVGATPDKNAASCWNTSPNYNRWFKFTATGTEISIHVQPSGVTRPLRRINAAIWEADGVTQVACKRYQSNYDTVEIESVNLTPGNTYYLSVDNNYQGYRGNFSLYVNDSVGYDFYEGAKDVTALINSQSPDQAYSTLGATPDKNPGSCWNTSPNYNRWFKFKASSPGINIEVLRGGSYGTVRRIQVALYDSTGTNELACDRYMATDDIVDLDYEGLTPGKWYYFSVDNNNYWYRGTFTLKLNDSVSYDYYEGAIELTDIHNWTSDPEQFSTIDASPDKNAASCWNTSPNYNRWFKFTATSSVINVSVLRGGSYGTVRRINLALWEADGTTEVACARYMSNDDIVTLGSNALVPGNTYYISVDNNYFWYRGTFTLHVNDAMDYDFYEGAIELSDLVNWQSDTSAYTTRGASPDRNAASCWNTSPNYNRWFKFQAIHSDVSIQVLRDGASLGDLRRINLALWEADGTTELACARYINENDNVSLTATGLTVGNWYYISVDNNNYWRRGSFTLQINNASGDEYWAIADGNWSNAATWSLSEGGPPATSSPSSGDVVHIKGYNVILNSNESCASLDLNINNAATSLTIDGGILTVNGSVEMTNHGFNFQGQVDIRNSGQMNIRDDMHFDRRGGSNLFSISLEDDSELNVGKDMYLSSSSGTGFENILMLSGNAVLDIGQDLIFNHTGGIKSQITVNDNASLTVYRDIQFNAIASNAAEIEVNQTAKLYPGRDILRTAMNFGILDFNDNSEMVFNSSDFIQSWPGNTGAGGDAFSYRHVEINNTRIASPQVRLTGAVILPGNLSLTRGKVGTSNANMLTIASTASIAGGSSISFIDGPLAMEGNSARLFPIGKSNRYMPLGISAPASPSDVFIAEYFNQSPDPTYNTTSHEASLDHVGDCEFWKLDRTSGTSSVDVTLYWDGNGCCISSLAQLKQAVWDGSQWLNYGNAGTTGNVNAGSIQGAVGINGASAILGFADQAPIVNFSDPGGPYCESAAAIILTGTPTDANGAFSGRAVQDNGDGTGSFDPAIAGKGSHQITYTYIQPATGCSGSINKTVAVNPLPTATMLGTDTVCIGNTVDFSVYFTGTAPWTFTYSDGVTPVTITTSDNPYIITTNVVGTYQVTAVSDANGCIGNDFGNSVELVNWSLPAKPSISIASGTTTFCEGSSVVLETAPAPLYYWSNAISTQQNTIDDPGSYTVQVVDNNGCFSPASDPVTVTVLKVPRKPASIYGSDGVCQNGINTEYSTTSMYAESYTWNLSPAVSGTIIGTGTHIEIDWNESYSGIAKLWVHSSNADCGDSPTSDTLFITVNAIPDDPGAISGDPVVCQGESGVAYSISPVNNALSYSWALPNNASIAGAANGTNINVDFSNQAASGQVVVSALNACGSSTNTSSFNVTVQLMSVPASSISRSANNISPNDTVILKPVGGSLGEGASWHWYLDAAGTTSAGPAGDSLIVTPTVNTTYWVRAEGTCNTSTMASVTVTINPLPLKPATPVGADTLCENSVDQSYTTTGATGAASYNWRLLPAGSGSITGTGTTGTVNWTDTWSGTASIVVEGQNGSGTGPVSDTLKVKIWRRPKTGPAYHIGNQFNP